MTLRRTRDREKDQGENQVKQSSAIKVEDADEQEMQVMASPPKVQAQSPIFEILFHAPPFSRLL